MLLRINERAFVPLHLHQRERVLVEVAEHYTGLAEKLRHEDLPYGTSWRDVEAYRARLVQEQQYQWVNFREQVGHQFFFSVLLLVWATGWGAESLRTGLLMKHDHLRHVVLVLVRPGGAG